MHGVYMFTISIVGYDDYLEASVVLNDSRLVDVVIDGAGAADENGSSSTVVTECLQGNVVWVVNEFP